MRYMNRPTVYLAAERTLVLRADGVVHLVTLDDARQLRDDLGLLIEVADRGKPPIEHRSPPLEHKAGGDAR